MSKIYQAKQSVIVGKVRMDEDVNIWYYATIRADADMICIGKGSNIQDHVVIHVDHGFPVTIGNYVTVGHGAILHGCTVGNNTVIGMGAIVLNNAVIGKNCIIGAGALIPQNKDIPDNSVVLGNPGRIVRNVSKEEIVRNYENALEYIQEAKKAFSNNSAFLL